MIMFGLAFTGKALPIELFTHDLFELHFECSYYQLGAFSFVQVPFNILLDVLLEYGVYSFVVLVKPPIEVLVDPDVFISGSITLAPYLDSVKREDIFAGLTSGLSWLLFFFKEGIMSVTDRV